jgi:hypothetical protein
MAILGLTPPEPAYRFTAISEEGAAGHLLSSLFHATCIFDYSKRKQK